MKFCDGNHEKHEPRISTDGSVTCKFCMAILKLSAHEIQNSKNPKLLHRRYSDIESQTMR